MRTQAEGGREAYYRQGALLGFPHDWVKVVEEFADTGLGFVMGKVVTAVLVGDVRPEEPKL